MKHLKIFENFQSEEEISKICKKFDIHINNWTINNGLVYVDGDVNLSSEELTKIPLNFGIVSGNFWCDYNQLTSLEGCPNTVGGNFLCGGNQLTTLEGCPNTVGGNFRCDYNKLTSLEGSPQSVGGNFRCGGNPVYNIWKLISTDNKLDYQIIELLNDYDCLRGKDIIIDRFNDFLEEIGKNPVKSIEGYNNI